LLKSFCLGVILHLQKHHVRDNMFVDRVVAEGGLVLAETAKPPADVYGRAPDCSAKSLLRLRRMSSQSLGSRQAISAA
jgi:hypothetical protein